MKFSILSACLLPALAFAATAGVNMTAIDGLDITLPDNCATGQCGILDGRVYRIRSNAQGNQAKNTCKDDEEGIYDGSLMGGTQTRSDPDMCRDACAAINTGFGGTQTRNDRPRGCYKGPQGNQCYFNFHVVGRAVNDRYPVCLQCEVGDVKVDETQTSCRSANPPAPTNSNPDNCATGTCAVRDGRVYRVRSNAQGNQAKNTCKDDEEGIYDQLSGDFDECREACAAIGLGTDRNTQNRNDRPRGCYHGPQGNICYFNTNNNGRAINNRYPVCRQCEDGFAKTGETQTACQLAN